ncbi:MAG: LysE family transporter [Opitutaceae bacterium]|jgi:RhtB (resistance to homoserine/threonine) family protein
MSGYGAEFLRVAVVTILAVISPGPDFAIVLKQSLNHGHRAAVWTAIGIGTGLCLHVTYSLLGLGVLIRSSQAAFTVLKFAAAAYFAWLGITDLRSRPRDPEVRGAPESGAPEGPGSPSRRAAWRTGFMVNALNPKVTLFFVALFAAVISPRTPKLLQAGYGLWVPLTATSWFCLVGYVFTRQRVRAAYLRHGHWIDRALGCVFILLATSLALATLR